MRGRGLMKTNQWCVSILLCMHVHLVCFDLASILAHPRTLTYIERFGPYICAMLNIKLNNDFQYDGQEIIDITDCFKQTGVIVSSGAAGAAYWVAKHKALSMVGGASTLALGGYIAYRVHKNGQRIEDVSAQVQQVQIGVDQANGQLIHLNSRLTDVHQELLARFDDTDHAIIENRHEIVENRRILNERLQVLQIGLSSAEKNNQERSMCLLLEIQKLQKQYEEQSEYSQEQFATFFARITALEAAMQEGQRDIRQHFDDRFNQLEATLECFGSALAASSNTTVCSRAAHIGLLQ